jgi:hypothetical protein
LMSFFMTSSEQSGDTRAIARTVSRTVSLPAG